MKGSIIMAVSEFNNITIAVLSGKGGTGKTFVSTNLTLVSHGFTYIDCDVEAPNGHLYFEPQQSINQQGVDVLIPQFDSSKCIQCRQCIDFCKFNALAMVKEKVFVFEQVCHHCGGCSIVCPTGALEEIPRQIGVIKSYESKGHRVLSGELNLGEVSGVPVIKRLHQTNEKNSGIIDCPPGSGCSVMESIQNVDYLIMVAEASSFGAHNLEMIHELAAIMKKPYSVILNKTTNQKNPSKDYCERNGIQVLAEIPYDKTLARWLSEGEIPVLKSSNYRKLFEGVYMKVIVGLMNEEITRA